MFSNDAYSTRLTNFNVTKFGSKIKNITHGASTILIMKNHINDNDYLKKMYNLNKEVSHIMKKAIRWNNLKWILEHRKGKFNINSSSSGEVNKMP